MPYTDYVVGNETEMAAYAESHSWGITDLVEIAKKIAKLPKKNEKQPRVVIVTQGTDPTIAAISNTSGDVEVKQMPIRKVDSKDITDTNGAGYDSQQLIPLSTIP